MARRRSSAPWRSHQTLEGRTSQSGRAARPRCAETRTSSKTGALFRPSRRDDGDDVLRRGPRRGLRVGEGPRQRGAACSRRRPRPSTRSRRRRRRARPSMNAPSSARSSKRSLRGRDTRQGTQFGRRGVGTGLGVSSAGDTNSWLWPASRASKSSKAIGPTGLFEGGAALKPARARAAMPKRGLEPRPSSEPAPKALPFASTTRALPGTGPGAPKRLRAGRPAPLSCANAEARRAHPAAAGLLDATDLPIRSRGLALRRS